MVLGAKFDDGSIAWGASLMTLNEQNEKALNQKLEVEELLKKLNQAGASLDATEIPLPTGEGSVVADDKRDEAVVTSEVFGMSVDDIKACREREVTMQVG